MVSYKFMMKPLQLKMVTILLCMLLFGVMDIYGFKRLSITGNFDAFDRARE